MVDARNFLTEAQRKQVSEAIAAAEKRTSAELVCAVASESGRYDRAEGILGLIVALICLSAVQTLLAGDSWEPVAVNPLYQGLAIAVGYLLGNLLGSYVPILRAPLVSEREKFEETARAASHVFSSQRCGSTRKSGGVLIYLSLFERRVLILADHGAGLTEQNLSELRDLAVARLKAGQGVEALTAPIAAAAEMLSGKLPYEADDVNELPDELILIHPRP